MAGDVIRGRGARRHAGSGLADGLNAPTCGIAGGRATHLLDAALVLAEAPIGSGQPGDHRRFVIHRPAHGEPRNLADCGEPPARARPTDRSAGTDRHRLRYEDPLNHTARGYAGPSKPRWAG